MKQYRPNDIETAAQAAEWLHSIQSDETREREGFCDWLLESRRNVRAALLTIAVEKELGQFDPERRFDVDALLAEGSGNVVGMDRSTTHARPRGALKTSWLAAAALACLALAWPMWRLLLPHGGIFATGTGQQQSIKLDDGSVVHLNTESRIQVEFSEHERGVRLLAGEAFFDVQHEVARPFQVHVDQAVVRALGTQFNIDRHGLSPTVSVLQGRVEISDGTGSAKVLAAGEEARMSNGAVEEHASTNVKRSIAWRDRKLEFQEDPLTTVAEEFNRYNRSPRLRIEGAAVGARTYTGILNADDPDSLAQVLSEDAHLAVKRLNGEIVISAR